MVDMYQRVLEFHEKFGHPVNVPITIKEVDLRNSLLDEEYGEVMDEFFPPHLFDDWCNWPPEEEHISAIDKVKLTKELCDLLYVTLGTAVTFGLPIREAFEEVHRSNMSKLGSDGKPILREDGKVLKSENYSPANLGQFFKEVTI